MDENKNIENKIKESFESMGNSAPAHIWDGVNKQLDIDRVWKRISAKLDWRTGIIYRRKIASIAALLLLLSGISIYLFKNKSAQFTNHNTNKSFVSENKNLKKEKKHSGNTKKIVQTQMQHSVQGKTNRINAVQSNVPQNFTLQQFNINNSDLNDSLSYLTMMPVKTIFVETNIASEPILSPILISNNNITATPHFRKKRLEIGITYSYNNTWIINNDTRNSYDENSLIQTAPTFVGSYGLVANYNMFSNSAISAEFYINSKHFQEYDEFIEGRFTNKSTEFNYYKLTLLYQFNINQSPYKIITSKYTFKAGIYGGYLKSNKHFYNGIILPETDQYAATDYGVKLAIGQEKKFRNIILGYGINAEYGFKNIFEKNAQMSSDFNVTKNALMGGYVNLKYEL